MPANTTTHLRAKLLSNLLVVMLAGGCATVDIGGPKAGRHDPQAGTLTLPGGKQIAVLPQALNYSGEGTFTWPDGHSRSGNWQQGRLQGMGTEITAEEHYSGQWLDGQRQGHGEVEYADGSRYVGDFDHGLAAGKGTWTSRDGVYQGTWKAGRRHGQGQFNGSDGTLYQGQWHEGLREGYGRQKFASGGLYDGDWLQDKPHGFGRFLFPTTAEYEGSWENGVRQGYGSWRSPANLSYEGTWRNDQRNGYGRETRPDGSYYAGAWQADKKQGRGKEVHADGSIHTGEWRQDNILGYGVRTNRAGITISGEWRENTIVRGTIALPGGPRYEGELFSPDGRTADAGLVKWLTRTAANHNAHAEYFLGTMYLDFDEPAQDIRTAAIWLGKAAEAGVAEAQFRLSLLLLDEDTPAALSWLQRAADLQHPAANQLLGEYFHTGLHVARSYPQAIAHYEAAVAKGSVVAVNNLAWLLATTADERIADPQRAVELIRPFVLYLGSWQHLDTLAAAHARLGDTERAQRVQNQALILARSLASETVLDEMAARLELYSADQAYIE